MCEMCQSDPKTRKLIENISRKMIPIIISWKEHIPDANHMEIQIIAPNGKSYTVSILEDEEKISV